jgi:PilZ domain
MHDFRSKLTGGAAPASPVARKGKPSERGTSLTKVPVRRTESRLTNQRTEDRIPVLLENVTILHRRRKRIARVINLSSGGGMIECDIEPRIGEGIEIELTENNRGKCVVRWIRGNRIGVEFEGYSLLLGRAENGSFVFRRCDEEDQAKEPERAQRQSLVWGGTLHANFESIPVRVHNLSPGGAMIQCNKVLEPGTDVLLDLAGAGMLNARVRWCEDGQIGIGFNGEFDVDTLSVCTPEPPAPGTVWAKPQYLEDELSPTSPWAARWEKLTLRDLGY